MIDLLSSPEFFGLCATVSPSRSPDIQFVPISRTPTLNPGKNDPTNHPRFVADLTSVLSATTAVAPEVPSVPRISVQNVDENISQKLSSPAVDPTAATTSEVPPISVPPIPSHDVGGSEPSKFSSGGVDPATAKDNEPNWKSALYASTKVAIDMVGETPDVFIPLKSVARGIFAALKYYDVCHCFFWSFISLTFELGSNSKPQST